MSPTGARCPRPGPRWLRLDDQLAEQRDGAVKAEHAVELTNQAADAGRRYALYRRAVELRDEIGKLDANHPSVVPLPELRSALEQLRNLEFRLSELRAELAAEPDLSGYTVAIANPRWGLWLVLGGLLLAGGAAVAVVGLVAQAALVGFAAAAVLVVSGVLALFGATRQRRRLNDIQMQNELRESEIARRLAGRTDLAERVRQTEQERAEALGSLALSDLSTAETTLVAETEHSAKIGARRAEYRGLMGDDPTADDVGLLRDQAAAEADECRHALAGMGDIGREPEKFAAGFQLAVQRLTSEREAAFRAAAQAEARVSTSEVDAEQVAAVGEALESAEETLAGAERRLRIYEDVLATLNGAEMATMKKAARYLEQRMAADIERITDGRYRRLKVDEATLTFTVYSPESDDWVDVRRLSQGTLDQFYLCARLGIIRQVTQPATPPLVLDDPFITFDDERARRSFALLKEIASDLQVIYLTCSERYDEMADKVVVLPAPEGRDDSAPPATAEPADAISTAAEPASHGPERR